MNQKNKLKYIKAGFIFFIGLLIAGGFLLKEWSSAHDLAIEESILSAATRSREQNLETVSGIIQKFEKKTNVSKTEIPIVAQILDVDNLKRDHTFYKNAQNGDILILYRKANKAFIYRIKDDALINEGTATELLNKNTNL